jgi:hypothetical protein
MEKIPKPVKYCMLIKSVDARLVFSLQREKAVESTNKKGKEAANARFTLRCGPLAIEIRTDSSAPSQIRRTVFHTQENGNARSRMI